MTKGDAMSDTGDSVVVDTITVTNQGYVRPNNVARVTPSDSIDTKGILHFTIGVRDHIAAAKFYSEVLSCRHLRSNERYSFMECGGTYFVLAKIPHHVNPNNPDEDAHHHAFLVEKDEFDRAMEILRVRGIRLVKYSDEGHHSFPGRHAYFHDADGNCIEICYLYPDGEK
jgi:catechol 2,3-dioxygenase-like lactoylglutathione lyase family enzyme